MAESKSTVNFQIGKTYLFTINRIDNDFCELLDSDGFVCYLQDTNKYQFTKGQNIQCRVLDYKSDAKHPKIEIVETEDLVLRDAKVDERGVNGILKELDIRWNFKGFVNLLLMPDNGNAFDEECHRWIRSLIDSKADLTSIRKDCFIFLEESIFLSICKPAERDFYQQRITKLIEMMGYYIKANKLKEDGEGLIFIETLFDKLKKSGFVYHPNKNFNIMSCLFLNDRNLMEDKVEELFGILRQWGLDIWMKEPFRSTLINVLEVYINENIWKVDREKNTLALVNNLMQALSIQFLLIGDAMEVEGIDIRLNISRLCALSTYYNVRDPKSIMDLTIANLLNSEYCIPKFSLADTGRMVIPYFIDNTAKRNNDIGITCSYLHGKAKLVLSKDGISLYSNQDDQIKAILSKDLNLWANMQVYINKKAVKTPVGKKNIAMYERLWDDIEKEIFTVKEVSIKKLAQKQQHHVDDYVNIIITKRHPTRPNLFACKIIDEIGGSGYIATDQIVPYPVYPVEKDFLADNGRSLVFEAKIIDKTADGDFRFSMLDIIKEIADNDFYVYDDRIICSLGADRPLAGRNKRIPAISKDGISISLGGFDDLDVNYPFKKGDVVVATYESCGSGSFLVNCSILELCENQDFYVIEAFRNLLREIALTGENVDSVVQEEDIQQNDRLLAVPYMKEVIRAIDRMAIIDDEYVKSYNYLGFARILCLMIGWENQAAYYKGRMDLIAMLHDFAINDRVDEDKLELLDNANAEMFNSNILLKERYEQLKIVSYLGKPQHQQDLLARYTDSQGILHTLASLVLGYNIMKSQNMESQANDVHNRIKQTLKLKGFESNLVMYGSGIEDLKTEYKQSIVFPPNVTDVPNLTLQTSNVMRVIAEFLNTEGGILYLGVNDCGAGVGLENDLMYHEFNGDKDKYQRYISDTIANTWGNVVATCVKDISFDSENKDKDVLIIRISPYPKGVEYEGKWYVRTVSSKRALTYDEFSWYNSHNRQIEN